MAGQTPINIDGLKQEIATRYKLIITDDDPIFTVMYVHQIMLEQYNGLLGQQFLEMQAGLETTSQQLLAQTELQNKGVAGQTVKAIESTGNTIEQKLQRLFNQQHERFEEQHQVHHSNLKWMFWTAIGSAGVSVLSLAGITWLVLPLL